MGYFIAVSAIRGSSISSVSDAVVEYATEFNVRVSVIEKALIDTSPKTDALVYTSDNQWIIVLWPDYFNIHDFPLCESLSKRLNTVISTIHVYDDDYWAHGLFDSGTQLDIFCSVPDYFAEDEATAQELLSKWKGRPEIVASKLGKTEGLIRGYMVSLSNRKENSSLFSRLLRTAPKPPTGKVSSSDQFEIENFWVFTDFWGKLGINYPEDMEAWVKLIRFDRKFQDKLPTSDEL